MLNLINATVITIEKYMSHAIKIKNKYKKIQ